MQRSLFKAACSENVSELRPGVPQTRASGCEGRDRNQCEDAAGLGCEDPQKGKSRP
jgi:hypothetical protein